VLGQSSGVDPFDVLAKVGNAIYTAEQGNNSFLMPAALAVNPELRSDPAVQQFVAQYGTQWLSYWTGQFSQQMAKLPPDVQQTLLQAKSFSSLNSLGVLALTALYSNQPQSLPFLGQFLKSAQGPFNRENVFNSKTLEASFPLLSPQESVKQQLVAIVSQQPSLLNYHDWMIADLLHAHRYPQLTAVRVDIPFAYQERYAYTSVSGGTANDVFQPVACYGQLCRQVELYPVAGTVESVFPQAKCVVWVDQKQKVTGGSGRLAGEEPTGQKPFGTAVPFKIV
ncbi:MAG: hypothetical protein ACK8QZ_12670, partial [Anaerolineales bacterium]